MKWFIKETFHERAYILKNVCVAAFMKDERNDHLNGKNGRIPLCYYHIISERIFEQICNKVEKNSCLSFCIYRTFLFSSQIADA